MSAKIHLRHQTALRAWCNATTSDKAPLEVTIELREVTCGRCLRYHKLEAIRTSAKCVECGATSAVKFYGLSGADMKCNRCFKPKSKKGPRVYQFGDACD